MNKQQQLQKLMDERILILDGAMGTMIQEARLSEEEFRGELLADHDGDLKGNNDLLVLTNPKLIEGIHTAYIEAGADIIETNSFNATRISQSEYRLAHLADQINEQAACLARQAADKAEERLGRSIFVAGAMGPTSRTASISPDVNDPGKRNVTFDELADDYRDAARALARGGADLFLVETVFDTLNAKAALYAIMEVNDELQEPLPIFVSGTITDMSGRTLSGQTAEAFWISIAHAKPLAVGLNCALGPKELRSYVHELSRASDSHILTYPNAGLPNEMGGYDETPEDMAAHISAWARDGLVNIVGGCCGTTPAHIKAMAKSVAGIKPKPIIPAPPALRLSGLEPFEVRG